MKLVSTSTVRKFVICTNAATVILGKAVWAFAVISSMTPMGISAGKMPPSPDVIRMSPSLTSPITSLKSSLRSGLPDMIPLVALSNICEATRLRLSVTNLTKE